MRMQTIVAQWYRQLPIQRKEIVRDVFINILKENNCVVNKVEGLNVDWDFSITHKEVQKILDPKREILSLDELNYKEKRKLEKKQHIWSKRLQSKALAKSYTMLL